MQGANSLCCLSVRVFVDVICKRCGKNTVLCTITNNLVHLHLVGQRISNYPQSSACCHRMHAWPSGQFRHLLAAPNVSTEGALLSVTGVGKDAVEKEKLVPAQEELTVSTTRSWTSVTSTWIWTETTAHACRANHFSHDRYWT